MVTGNEYVFDNIDEALKYVLETEQRALSQDPYRQKPPMMVRQIPGLFSQPFSEEIVRQAYIPVDSLDYSLSAYFNNATNDKFVMTRLRSGRYSLKPNLRHRKFLFRGESEFHSPCKPNLFRSPKQRRFTRELLKGQEMKLLMLSHPLVQLLDMGMEINGELVRFEMNLFGLTQHYYNKTSFLDLTSDPLVASFFASTTYDWNTDRYYPIEDENHNPGVLYYYSLDVNEDFAKSTEMQNSPLSTIGLQVFPRSGKQKGFLYNMQLNENFNDVVRVNAVRFKHRANISKRICALFNNGESLFTNDILMHHWRSWHKGSNVISNRTVLMNKIDNPLMTLGEVEAETRDLGFDIQDYVPRFTADEIDQYYAEVQNHAFWPTFCSQIHIPGDKNGQMMQAILSLPSDPRYRWAFEHDESHVAEYEKGFVMRVYRECLT